MWELWGVEISAYPLTWHIAYTTACCYRTSRNSQLGRGRCKWARGEWEAIASFTL